jgi:hypothetical protein
MQILEFYAVFDFTPCTMLIGLTQPDKHCNATRQEERKIIRTYEESAARDEEEESDPVVLSVYLA